MKTTAEETAALVLIASGQKNMLAPALYIALHEKGLARGSALTEAAKEHLRAIALAMSGLKGSEMPVAETAPAEPRTAKENATTLSANVGGQPL